MYSLKGIALGSRWGYQKTAKIDLNKFKLHIVTLKCFRPFLSFCVYGMLIYDAAKVSQCNLNFSFKILHFCNFFPVKLCLLQIYTHLSTFLASLMVNHFGVVIERILWAFVFDYFYTSFFFPFNIAFELLII